MTSTINDLYTPLQRLSTAPLRQPRSQTTRPYTSFYIKDILGSQISTNDNTSESSSPTHFKRRESWSGPPSVPRPRLGHQRSTEEVKTAVKQTRENGDSPLSALEELANKTFTGPDTSILRAAEAATTTNKREALSLLNRQQPRKKRKSRTAFSNHQIFELERRFLYQKYLTPADRDELASTLGLTNAQVITWFQNRRAKLKRDIDELKNDVRATSTTPPHLKEDKGYLTTESSVYDHEEGELYTEDSSSELMSPIDPRQIGGGTCDGNATDGGDDHDKMSVHYVDSDNEDASMSISKSSPSPADNDPDDQDIDHDNSRGQIAD
nr:transcription factor LBX2-like isoform X1 [Lytechinus pictus]